MLMSNEFVSIYNNSNIPPEDKPWLAYQKAIEMLTTIHHNRHGDVHSAAVKANFMEEKKLSKDLIEAAVKAYDMKAEQLTKDLITATEKVNAAEEQLPKGLISITEADQLRKDLIAVKEADQLLKDLITATKKSHDTEARQQWALMVAKTYEQVAQSLGFSGAHTDLIGFMATNLPDIDATEPPLISFSDLFKALKRGSRHPVKHFFAPFEDCSLPRADDFWDLTSESNFINMIKKHKWMKEHAIHTIASSNRDEGYNKIKLYKLHLYHYAENDICTFDATELFMLKQAISDKQSQINEHYYLYSPVLEAQYNCAKIELKRIFDAAEDEEHTAADILVKNKFTQVLIKAKEAGACDSEDALLQVGLELVLEQARNFMAQLMILPENQIKNVTVHKPTAARPDTPNIARDSVRAPIAKTIDPKAERLRLRNQFFASIVHLPITSIEEESDAESVEAPRAD